MNKKESIRGRNWSFIGYPESLPEDFIDIINKDFTQWCMSPLHDKDVNPDGSIKKPHYHIVLKFEGKKSYNQILSISSSVNGTVPQLVNNMSGMIRYLTHQDNPEKAQYNKSDIKCFNGFDITQYEGLNSGQIRQILKDIFLYVRENDIRSFAELVDMCCEEDKDTWFDIITVKHTIPIKEYIKSYAFMHIARDPLTGDKLVNPDGTFIYVGYGVNKK